MAIILTRILKIGLEFQTVMECKSRGAKGYVSGT